MRTRWSLCSSRPYDRTAALPIQLVKGAVAVDVSWPSNWSGPYTSLIGFNSRQLKMPKGDELPCNGVTDLSCLYATVSANTIKLNTELNLGLPAAAVLLEPKRHRSRSQWHKMSKSVSACSDFTSRGIRPHTCPVCPIGFGRISDRCIAGCTLRATTSVYSSRRTRRSTL